jgi:lysozyme family protein
MLYDIAFKTTKEFEGGYVNNPDDPGGETFRGISRVANPHWDGWADVDNVKKTIQPGTSRVKTANIINKAFLNDTDMATSVYNFYKNEQWTLANPDLPDRLRIKLFDTGVNMGFYQANLILQKSLNSLGSNLSLDGIIGPLSLQAVKEYTVDNILDRYSYFQAERYRLLVRLKPVKKQFLNAWLRRAAWHPILE